MDDIYQNQSTSEGSGEHVVDLLSAYIDNALDPVERQSVSMHLDTCASCRTEHQELLGTQVMLRSLPAVAPPRAFTLTPEMVSTPARGSFWQRLLAPALAPRYAAGSAAAFAVMALLVIGNFALIERNALHVPSTTAMKSSAGSEQAAAPPAVGGAEQDTSAQRNAGSLTTGVGTTPAAGTGAEHDLGTTQESGGQAGATTSDASGQISMSTAPTAEAHGPEFLPMPGGTVDQYAYSQPGPVPSALPLAETVLALAGCLLAVGALLAWRRPG